MSRVLQDYSRVLTPAAPSLQDIAAAVGKIEPEKSSKVQEAKSFLVSNPTCASTPQLHGKVDEANNKYTKIEQLLQSSQEKYVSSSVGQSILSVISSMVYYAFVYHSVEAQLYL